MRVWKYSVQFSALGEPLYIRAPACAMVVHVEPGHAYSLTIWLQVDYPVMARREFRVYATGQPIEEYGQHVHTWRNGSCIWHLYDFGEDNIGTAPDLDTAP